ncbi:MAG: YdcF family protein [Crocinitomicaceae bacterium]|nr:YdcF family protein [Crocinitomicaceae bacterium]
MALFSKPLFWLIVLFFLGRYAKKERLKKWSNRILIFGIFFFTNPFIFLEFMRLWETEGTKIESVNKTYDYGIVLGGMAEYDNNHKRLSLRRGGDRMWQAIHLYKLGKVERLLICGSNGYVLDDPLNEAVQFKEVLIEMGVPEEDILIDQNSKNTYQNAVEAKSILDADTLSGDVLLITSALHMRRSRACFNKVGVENFDCFTTDHYTGEIRGYSWDQYIIPNFSVLLDWNRLTHEWVGYIAYVIAGYL